MGTREHSAPKLLTREAYEHLPTIPADHRLFYGPDPPSSGTSISRSSRGLTRCSCFGMAAAGGRNMDWPP